MEKLKKNEITRDDWIEIIQKEGDWGIISTFPNTTFTVGGVTIPADRDSGFRYYSMKFGGISDQDWVDVDLAVRRAVEPEEWKNWRPPGVRGLLIADLNALTIKEGGQRYKNKVGIIYQANHGKDFTSMVCVDFMLPSKYWTNLVNCVVNSPSLIESLCDNLCSGLTTVAPRSKANKLKIIAKVRLNFLQSAIVDREITIPDGVGEVETGY